MKRKKKVILIILAVIGVLVFAELLALVFLFKDITHFQKYWNETAQKKGEFTYVALGDSAAQGLGASKPQNGYVGLLAKKIQIDTGKTVRIVNLSKSGAKVADVLEEQLPMLKKYKPDLVTVEIGANNVANFDDLQFQVEFHELVKQLPTGSYVANMPYFGSRPKRRPQAERISEIITENIKLSPGLTLVDLQSITKERDSIRGYAADYFHPNDHAYKNWAEAFWREIKERK